MDASLLTILFAINIMQILWLIGYKKYFSLKQTLFLTSFIFFQLIINHLYVGRVALALLLPFVIIEFWFVFSYLKSWTLAALYAFVQNTMLAFSWFLIWDIPYILGIYKVITINQLYSFLPIAIPLQQLLIFVFILITKKITIKYHIFESISHLQKKYIFLSLFFFFLLIVFNVIRQITVRVEHFPLSVERYLYLTFLLLALTIIFCFGIYIISRFYQQKQEIVVLSKTLTKESEKINLANEFRHDYRNILLSLSSYLDQKQFEQARAYLSSITNYSNSVTEIDYFTHISIISIPPVQGILFNFAENCLKNNIPVQFSIEQPISYLDVTIDLLDFIRCLSIVLDNALEASLETQNPLIKVMIKKQDSSLTIEVKNISKGKISIEQLLKKHFTTKKNHQGKGLTILIKLLKQYRKTHFSFVQENNFFIARFSLPKSD